MRKTNTADQVRKALSVSENKVIDLRNIDIPTRNSVYMAFRSLNKKSSDYRILWPESLKAKGRRGPKANPKSVRQQLFAAIKNSKNSVVDLTDVKLTSRIPVYRSFSELGKNYRDFTILWPKGFEVTRVRKIDKLDKEIVSTIVNIISCAGKYEKIIDLQKLKINTRGEVFAAFAEVNKNSEDFVILWPKNLVFKRVYKTKKLTIARQIRNAVDNRKGNVVDLRNVKLTSKDAVYAAFSRYYRSMKDFIILWPEGF